MPEAEEITAPHEGSPGSYSDQMNQMQSLAYFGADGQQDTSNSDPN